MRVTYRQLLENIEKQNQQALTLETQMNELSINIRDQLAWRCESTMDVLKAARTRAVTASPQASSPCLDELLEKARNKALATLVDIGSELPAWLEDFVRCQFSTAAASRGHLVNEEAEIQVLTNDLLKIFISCAPAALTKLLAQDYWGAAIAYLGCVASKLSNNPTPADPPAEQSLYQPATADRCQS